MANQGTPGYKKANLSGVDGSIDVDSIDTSIDTTIGIGIESIPARWDSYFSFSSSSTFSSCRTISV